MINTSMFQRSGLISLRLFDKIIDSFNNFIHQLKLKGKVVLDSVICCAELRSFVIPGSAEHGFNSNIYPELWSASVRAFLPHHDHKPAYQWSTAVSQAHTLTLNNCLFICLVNHRMQFPSVLFPNVQNWLFSVNEANIKLWTCVQRLRRYLVNTFPWWWR